MLLAAGFAGGFATARMVVHLDGVVRQRFETLGIEPVGNTPEQFAAEIKADMARWKEVVERANIKVD